MNALLLAIPLAPALAALAAPLLHRRHPEAAGPAVVAALAAALTGLVVLLGSEPSMSVLWVTPGGITLSAGLGLDGLSGLMALAVTGTALVTGVYALPHPAGANERTRFFAGLGLLTAGATAALMATTLLLVLVAWSVVAVASWLLLAFHHRDEHAQRTALRAFLASRSGDLLLVLACASVAALLGTTDLAAVELAARDGTLLGTSASLLALFVVGGAALRLAQMPFSLGLPDSGVSATPLGTLLHANTLIALEVYLLLRLEPLLAAAPDGGAALVWAGGALALVGALVATAEMDLKRLVAWCSVSVGGLALLALGQGSPRAAATLVVVHAACFSALYLCTAAVQRTAGTRRLELLGCLARPMPLTALIFAAAAVGAASFPPFTGFWGASRLLQDTSAGPALQGLVLGVVFLTAVALGRATLAVFGWWPYTSARAGAGDPEPEMAGPLALLGLCALGLGGVMEGHLTAALGVEPVPGVREDHGWALLMASATGLVFGAGRVRLQGPVAALGRKPCWLEGLLLGFTLLPLRAAGAVKRALGFERPASALRTVCARSFGEHLAAFGGPPRDGELRGLNRALTHGRFQVVAQGAGVELAEAVLDRAPTNRPSPGRLRQNSRTRGRASLLALAIFLALLSAGTVGAMVWQDVADEGDGQVSLDAAEAAAEPAEAEAAAAAPALP